MKVGSFALCVLLVLALHGQLCQAAETAELANPQAKPNIVFVLIDDFGYADCGAYGATDIRTPHIDRLASEGVKFTDFYANAPVCSPTRCGFITGRWQQRVGLEWAFGFSASSSYRQGDQWISEPDIHALGLPTSEVTLAQLLKDAGYMTGVFGKWHLGYQDQYNPTKRGFDEYFGELLGHSDFYNHSYYDGTYALREGLNPIKAEGYLTDLINQRAADFVDAHADKPFFLYVPHLAVHCPWQPPGRPLPSVTKENMYDGDRKDYAAMVERIDDGVGMLLDALQRHGILDNTLFVLSSDNGGERLSDNSPLFHKKSTLWEGGIRVPCLMRWPARLPAGQVTTQVGITMDLSATFASLAGVNVPEDKPFDGIDLMPILTLEQPAQTRALYWRIDRPDRQQKVVRHGDWKYISDGNTELLFDLANDISETRDMRYRHPEVFAELKAMLARWEQEMDRHPKEIMIK